MRRGPAALLPVAAAAVGAAWQLAACSPGEVHLEVRQRLFEHERPPLTGQRYECGFAGELRPAHGCLGLVYLPPVEAGAAGDGALPGLKRFRVPRALRGRSLIVWRWFRAADLDPWQPLPGLLVQLSQGELTVPLEAPPGSQTRVELRSVPSQERSQQSGPVRVPPDAVLEGGLALQTARLSGPGSRVEFRIVAHPAESGGTPPPPRVLLERVVDGRSEGERWLDYSLDLSGFAGRLLQLELATRPLEPDAAPAAFPLWSVPRLLAPEREETTPRSVVLVSIDTLRADHVGAYAGRAPEGEASKAGGAASLRPHTPNLDRLAAASAVFETAVATSPATTASHMSMFTGLYPMVHRIYQPRASLSRNVPTLAQILAAHGFTTGAVTEDGMIHAGSGFARGFDRYREFRGVNRRATTGHVAEVVDAGLAWLARHRREKTFLFLHTYEVHGPYEPPPEFDLYAASEAQDRGQRDSRAYAGEVAYTDHELGRLFDGLAELGLEDQVLLVTADHGEAFGEHGFGHGYTLYEEVIRVPMILHAPGLVPAGRRRAPVSLVDVAPTLLDLLSIQAPTPMQGRSLLPLARDPAAPGFGERRVYAEQLDGLELAVWQRGRKWIVNELDARRSGAYDLAHDREEHAPLTAPDVLAQGERIAGLFREEASRVRERLEGAETAPVEIDEATREELRALGYSDRPEQELRRGSR